MGKLLLLFTVVPLVDVYLLFYIGDLIGFFETVALVVATGVVGAWLAKREGMRVLRKWQEAIEQYQMPEEGVLGGLLVLVGAVLLVTPGVLTDATGLLLLIPPTRRLIAKVVRHYVERRIEAGSIQVVATGGLAGGLGGIAGGLGGSPRGPTGSRTAQRPRVSAKEPGVIDVEGEVIDV